MKVNLKSSCESHWLSHQSCQKKGELVCTIQSNLLDMPVKASLSEIIDVEELSFNSIFRRHKVFSKEDTARRVRQRVRECIEAESAGISAELAVVADGIVGISLSDGIDSKEKYMKIARPQMTKALNQARRRKLLSTSEFLAIEFALIRSNVGMIYPDNIEVLRKHFWEKMRIGMNRSISQHAGSCSTSLAFIK